MVPEIFKRSQLPVHMLRLEDDPNLPPNLARLLSHVQTEDRSVAGAWRQQGGQDSQQGGFSSTVRAEQSKDFPLPHLEGDSRQSLSLSVVAGQVSDFDNGWSSHIWGTPREFPAREIARCVGKIGNARREEVEIQRSMVGRRGSGLLRNDLINHHQAVDQR